VDRRILVITADCVEDTGRVSFRFKGECEHPDGWRAMPKAFGHVASDRDGSHSINVFEDGHLAFGGGWSAEPDEKWDGKVFADMPSCTLLMSAATFEWWETMCARHGVEFERHHFNGGLRTS